jgi:hypothetical protein
VPRQLALAADLGRWAAKDAERLGTSDASARGAGQLEEPKYRNPAPRPPAPRPHVGHPDYYKRFGFKNMPGIVHEGVPREVFLALSFDGYVPQGTVAFHEGFKADGQQGAPADG